MCGPNLVFISVLTPLYEGKGHRGMRAFGKKHEDKKMKTLRKRTNFRGMPKILLLAIAAAFPVSYINAQPGSGNDSFISSEKGKAKFTISSAGKSTSLYISSSD